MWVPVWRRWQVVFCGMFFCSWFCCVCSVFVCCVSCGLCGVGRGCGGGWFLLFWWWCLVWCVCCGFGLWGWLVFVGVVVVFEWVWLVGLSFWRGCMRFAVLS